MSTAGWALWRESFWRTDDQGRYHPPPVCSCANADALFHLQCVLALIISGDNKLEPVFIFFSGGGGGWNGRRSAALFVQSDEECLELTTQGGNTGSSVSLSKSFLVGHYV